MRTKRTRTGCWTCRDAGYKCDEQKPFCGRCLRLEIRCQGYGVRCRWRPVRTQGSTSMVQHRGVNEATGLELGLWSPGLSTSGLASSEKRLLHYWTNTLSGLLSASGAPSERNPFVVHLGAMVLEPSALQSIVLCMSANHLARSMDDSSLQTEAYRHQQSALRRLQVLVCDPVQSQAQTTLAAVLMMLVATRLFDEDEGAHCVNHLQGASAMIGRRFGSAEIQYTPAERFLLSLFSYHDILSSVSRGAPPLGKSVGFVAVEDVVRLQRITAVLHLVARVSQLQQLKTEPGFDVCSFHVTAAAIEISLHGLGPLSETPKTSCERDTEATVQAYRHAAFIYLYRVWFDAGAPTPATLEHVEQCLSALAQALPTSPLVSAHGWPLFTAGCEAILPSQRELARDRFEQMYASRRFPSLRRIKGDMEEVWRRKDAEQRVGGLDGMAKVDCIQVILRGRGREVNFL
ncbi:hypothetical protein P170DRAFT_511967 [Aspergillus steynii IBT 23096]|uniref:Zn(2)-C6 fungal-type domain-containing protein n=1 Tax=Aspergillus steynii IBT 23096 TaxID=1392250 RepID=A0A2I2G399_9EURO|nr:uncharacterized protein P170DRAFT_511967 [Aspergillus steynii IBT 23096]PLB47348.1 hypothetical protein P170DRAFT_511967 [Aspergillus steynii IBT 23096]